MFVLDDAIDASFYSFLYFMYVVVLSSWSPRHPRLYRDLSVLYGMPSCFAHLDRGWVMPSCVTRLWGLLVLFSLIVCS